MKPTAGRITDSRHSSYFSVFFPVDFDCIVGQGEQEQVYVKTWPGTGVAGAVVARILFGRSGNGDADIVPVPKRKA